ncbi:MAG: hypothetical protein J7577_12005 [Sphingobacteriaceae bacterium]|nr:hypothetical protein [Sphingobacteriaceae bacterium]
MKEKSIFLIGVCLLLGLQNAFSQLDQYRPTIASPNAAAMSVYGSIPVSNFTGTPNVSVPCYEVKTRSLSIPINLSYHTAGIRPEQHPGWVGTGWTLNAGGAISRSIKGYPDDQMYSENDKRGYYFTGSLLNSSDWTQYAKAGWTANSVEKTAFHNGLKVTDLEADEFSFSFLGYSGKFYYNPQTASFVVQSDQYLKVYLDPASPALIDPFVKGFQNYGEMTCKSFNRFIIEDDKGNKFVFGGSTAIEYSEPINTPVKGESFFATSWNLVKVITANNRDIVDFEYERGPYVAQLYRYASYTSVTSPDCSGSNQSNWRNGGSFISPVYLKGIKVKDGQSISFDFTPSNEMKYSENQYNALFTSVSLNSYQLLGIANDIPYYFSHSITNPTDRLIWFKLDKIRVMSDQGTLMQNINFAYNNTPTERLFLRSLTYSSADESLAQRYSFGYINKSNVPAYLSTVTDHWGFNNGVGFSSVFDPAATYGSRQPNPSVGSYGLLQTVIYPTGGKTVFEYESQTYSKIVDNKNRSLLAQSNGIAGGFRVKRIKSYAVGGTLALSKEYFYTKDYISNGTVSSGILNSTPVYSVGPYTATDMYPSTFTYSMYSNTPQLPLNDGGGTYIGYSEVTETETDALGKTNYTVYKYTNHDNGYIDDTPLASDLYNRDNAFHNDYSSRDYERGRLKTSEMYNSDRQQVKTVENNWVRDYESTSPAIRSLNFNFLETGINCSPYKYYPSSVSYVNYTYPFVQRSTVETNFSAGDAAISKTTTFSYNGQKQLLEQNVTKSNGGTMLTRITYPDQLAGIGTNVYAGMVLRGMVGIPIETTVYDNTQSTVLVSSHLTTYAADNDSYLILPKAELELEKLDDSATQNVKDVTTGTGSGLTYDSRYQTLVNYLDYDSYGNILSLAREHGPAESYVWSYKGRYPVAKIRNMSYSTVKSALGESNVTSFASLVAPSRTDVEAFINPLRSLLPETEVTSYTYLPSIGLSSSTDGKGMANYFDYNGFQQLLNIKDRNEHIIKNYLYHYIPLTEYSDSYSQVFIMQNCAPYLQGGEVTYTVPELTYSGTTIAEANAQASADVAANGQNYANANGPCYTIYARLEPQYYYEPDRVYATFYLRFYSDADGTVPLKVTSNLIVNYRVVTDTATGTSSTQTSSDFSLSGLNAKEVFVNNFTMNQCSEDFSSCVARFVSLLSSPGYTIIY